jgi:hypothetical protein
MYDETIELLRVYVDVLLIIPSIHSNATKHHF